MPRDIVSDIELGKRLSREAEAAFETLNEWKPVWQEIADYSLPYQADISRTRSSPNPDPSVELFETTALRSNKVLADGQFAGMTPADSPWMSYDPPEHLRGDDEAEQYYRRCTEIIQASLAKSNFYSEIYDFYLVRGGPGTTTIYCDEGKRSVVNFQTFPIGSYAIAEDEEGLVDKWFRCIPMKLRNVISKFGEDNLSAELQKTIKSARRAGKLDAQEVDIIHAIYPRTDYDPKKNDGPNKPIASVYFERKSKNVVKNWGYDEQPCFTSRYYKMAGKPYGWSPAFAALPEARQINFLEKQSDALAEVTAFPRILIPNTHEGEVDLRANGYTFFDPNIPSAMPKEWLTGGRYDVALDRINRKAKAIEQSFHVDFFQMFTQIEKEMTAYEAAQRAGEKLNQFASTFARLTTEVLNPLLQRVWSIHVRAAKLPPPPDSILERDADGVWLPEPTVSFSSRIALAIKALENNAFLTHVERMLPLWQLRPELTDNYEWDEVERDMARNTGVTARWIASMEKVNAIRKQRADQQAQMMQMQQLETTANAAQKVGSIKRDSIIGAFPKAA